MPLWRAGVQAVLLWHWWLGLPAHGDTAVTHRCSQAGWEAARHRKTSAGALVFLYSRGCTVTVRLLAGARRDGGCLWWFQVSTDRTCRRTVICSPVWQVVLCPGIIFQKTSSPKGSAAWREGPQLSAGGVSSTGGVSDGGRTERQCFWVSTGGLYHP